MCTKHPCTKQFPKIEG